jgi:hypothetical protein
MDNKHVLSKSTFMRSCQCLKSLYLNKHHKELRDNLDAGREAIFSRGINVGKLAQQLFPGGVDASPPSSFEYDKSVLKTAEYIKNGAKIIYEAAFIHDGVLAAADLLVNHNGKWKAYEVKSSTSVKEPFLLDGTLQYHVITNAGIPLTDISIIYLNNQYVRKGELKLRKLFKAESVIREAKKQQGFVVKQIEVAKTILKQTSAPKIDIGIHCNDPYPCDFIGHCFKHVPTISVFDISRLLSERKFELYNSGIVNLQDVPEDFPLNNAQRIQVDCYRTGAAMIDKGGIRRFLRSLEYPLCFLDFETFAPAVPLYDSSRPYQQIPFQYSAHCKTSPHATATHFEFLAEAGNDPRPGFIERLLSDLKGSADILTYNKSFEIGRLRELALAFPKYAVQLERIILRVKDLMLPFQQKLYYTPAMNGSYSIKAVLPALVPDLNYDSLAIADGSSASNAFEQLIHETDVTKISAIRNHLLEYCKMDTLAMLKILEVLEHIP